MFETSLDIDAPVAEVWAVISDVERWPEWTASVSEVKLLSPGPLAVGLRVRVKQPRLPTTVWEVTTLVPGQSFTWKATGPGMVTFGDHGVTATDGDRATATLGIRRTVPLAAVYDFVFNRVDQKYVTIEAQSLKRRCETA
ncbi:MAG: SRPBCC family protein [Actinomycetota bacterium]|nr:SRPBCC family protein [Actinomycetota bacterium]